MKDGRDVPDRVYDDPNAMAKAISRKTVGRNGVFGTTEQRFQRGPFASPKKNVARPGPGAYYEDRAEQFPSERAQSTAAFRSGVRRFGGHKPNSRKAMIDMQHAHEAQRRAHTSMSQGSTTSVMEWGTFGSDLGKKKKYPESKYKVGRSNNRGGGFTSTSGRFGTPGQRAALFGSDAGGPGPAGFNPSQRKSISLVRRRAHSRARSAGGFGSSTRFAKNRGSRLGPGTYDTRGSMAKRTYNVSYSIG